MFASDNIRLVKILENIYYNPVCHLASKKIFFLKEGLDLLDMTLNGGIIALYSYTVTFQAFRRLTIKCV